MVAVVIVEQGCKVCAFSLLLCTSVEVASSSLVRSRACPRCRRYLPSVQGMPSDRHCRCAFRCHILASALLKYFCAYLWHCRHRCGMVAWHRHLWCTCGLPAWCLIINVSMARLRRGCRRYESVGIPSRCHCRCACGGGWRLALSSEQLHHSRTGESSSLRDVWTIRGCYQRMNR